MAKQKVQDDATELEQEQLAAAGELLPDDTPSPQDEFDDVRDHEGEEERNAEEAAKEVTAAATEPDAGTETPAEPEEPSSEPGETKPSDEPIPEGGDEKPGDVLSDEEVNHVVTATGFPEYVARRLTPAEARRAVTDALIRNISQPQVPAQPAAPVPQRTADAQPEEFDVTKYGLKAEDWDEASLGQLAAMAKAIREETLSAVSQLRGELSSQQEQLMAAHQQQLQEAAIQRFDNWVAEQKMADLYGEGPSTSIKEGSEQFQNREQVIKVAAALSNGWNSRANNGGSRPTPEQFFTWAANAVHANFQRNTARQEETLAEQTAGMISRPTHKGAKPLSADEAAERELEKAGFYTPILRDPSEFDEGEF